MNLVPKLEAKKPETRLSPTELKLENPVAEAANDAHPLEARVAGWNDTRAALHTELIRRNYGLAEPVRRAMEIGIVSESSFVPSELGGASNVHLDILRGNEDFIEWEDVYHDEATDSRGEFERRCF